MSLKISRSAKAKAGKPAAYNHAPLQEKKLAARLGASLTKGSGAKAEKGDVRQRGIYRIECKSTSNKSFALTREIYSKIQSASAATGEIGCVTVDFLNDNGSVQESLAVISVEDLTNILQELANARG